MNELFRLIEDWAHARNIINGCGQKDQYAKLMSEFGELCIHIDDIADLEFLGDSGTPEDEMNAIVAKIQDDIGDCVVVLTILAAQNGTFIGDVYSSGAAVRGAHPHSCVLRLGRTLGLLGDAIAKKQPLDIDTTIRASLDYLSGVSSQYGMPLANCVSEAYDEIKDRKGIMYNGTFIKESDPAYAGAKFQVDAENGSVSGV